MEVYGRTAFLLQPTQESSPEQDSSALPKGGNDSMVNLCLNRLLAGPVVPWTQDPILEPVERFILLLKSFLQAESGFPIMAIGEWSSPASSWLGSFIIFSLPCADEEEGDRAAWLGTLYCTRVNPPHQVKQFLAYFNTNTPSAHWLEVLADTASQTLTSEFLQLLRTPTLEATNFLSCSEVVSFNLIQESLTFYSHSLRSDWILIFLVLIELF